MRRLLGDSVLVITISMNSAAFIAEIIRGGLLSVDQGQRDAAYSIGLSPFLSYWEVILPQAFVAAFPALGNSFIAMIKNTAIGFMIGVVDILAEAKILAASSLNFFEAYLSVGVVYWGMLILIHKILRRMETRICRFL